jgi:hypothetical protein
VEKGKEWERLEGELRKTAVFMGLTLDAAVPMWARELHDRPWSYLQHRATVCGQAVAEHGDVLQFGGGGRKGATAEAFNRLAEGLACLSFAPGGVTFLGRHWEHFRRPVPGSQP